ncbi:hypothetical protein [Undibacterium griseum]|nr:hypothetical protein [Undibacterium griseum]
MKSSHIATKRNALQGIGNEIALLDDYQGKTGIAYYTEAAGAPRLAMLIH